MSGDGETGTTGIVPAGDQTRKNRTLRFFCGVNYGIIYAVFSKLIRYRFLFEELVKRDFKKKYKRSYLGMGWSMLSPLLMLTVMDVVFKARLGDGVAHYTTFLFCGILLFNWFSAATNGGMRSLLNNAGIFTKVNVPKYLFLLSYNVQTFINFALSLVVFFVFCAIDHIAFSWRFVMLLYPMATMMLLGIGLGMVLSAFFVFFRDIDYLWTVALQLLMYGSALFYTIDNFPPKVKLVFALNPVYRHIAYFREIVIGGTIPTLETHLTLLGFAVASLLAGSLMYKHYNTRFLYYV